MIDAETTEKAMDTLSAIPFFPTAEGTRVAITRELLDICATNEQVTWLSRRCLKLFTKWPGPTGMRAVACSKFKPKDGIEFDSCPEFPDGVPSERQQVPAIAAPDRREIEPSADPGLSTMVKRLGEAHVMPRPTALDIAAVQKFYDKDGNPR